MEVSRISPAPSAQTRSAHSIASSPVGVRPPWVTTSQPPSSRRRASMATTMHCAPYSCAPARTSSGSLTAAVLNDTLSAPGAQHPPRVLDGAHSPADRERDEHFVGDALDDVHHRVAGVARRGDVEEHELVGALGVVARRELDRITGVADADEVDALHDAPGVDIEARDHADGEHAAIPSSTVKRPS